MANLLVLMEYSRGALLPVSLEALGQARRLGSTLGLTVYAVVAMQKKPGLGSSDEDITVRCGRFGADKVLLLTGEELVSESEMRYDLYEKSLLQACTIIPPRLFLLGDTPAGRDLGPRLAARLGIAFLGCGAALVEEGQLVLCDQNGTHLRATSDTTMIDGQPPAVTGVVITIPAGRHQMAWGVQDAELSLLTPEDDAATTIPNLKRRDLVRRFVEQGVDELPIAQRVSFTDEENPQWTDFPSLWRIFVGDEIKNPGLLNVSIGPRADERAEYSLCVLDEEVSATSETLRTLLAAPGPVVSVLAPGQTPPVRLGALQGFDASNEQTPAVQGMDAEGWDEMGDTLSGGEPILAQFVSQQRAYERTRAPDAQGRAPVAPLPSPTSPRELVQPQPPQQGLSPILDESMWDGGATDAAGVDPDAVNELGRRSLDWVNADTAPVKVVAPASGKTPPLPRGRS